MNEIRPQITGTNKNELVLWIFVLGLLLTRFQATFVTVSNAGSDRFPAYSGWFPSLKGSQIVAGGRSAEETTGS